MSEEEYKIQIALLDQALTNMIRQNEKDFENQIKRLDKIESRLWLILMAVIGVVISAVAQGLGVI